MSNPVKTPLFPRVPNTDNKTIATGYQLGFVDCGGEALSTVCRSVFDVSAESGFFDRAV